MKIKVIMLSVLLGISLCGGAAQREIDYAAEDAAVKTINELNAKNFDLKRIAFIGLAGNVDNLKTVFQGGLQRDPGKYEFYTRDDNEWNILLSEIEFGERKKDIMDPATIQKFGNKIKGVDAYLYGKILEAAVKENGDAIFRVSLTLSKVETGQQLWSANIIGTFRKAVAAIEVSPELTKAAMKAGTMLAEQFLKQVASLSPGKIFVLPLVGNGSEKISDIVLAELNSPDNSKFPIFSDMNVVDKTALRDVALQLSSAPAGTGTGSGDVGKKLEALYNAPSGTAGSASESYYLVCTVKNCSDENKEGRVILNASFCNLKNNQVLWGKTVEGKFREETSDLLIKETVSKNRIISVGLVVGLIVLVGLGGLVFIVRRLTSPR